MDSFRTIWRKMLQTLRERSQKRKKLLAQTVRTIRAWSLRLCSRTMRIRFFHAAGRLERGRVATDSWNRRRRHAEEKVEIRDGEVGERCERFKGRNSADRRDRLQGFVHIFKGMRICVVRNQATLLFTNGFTFFFFFFFSRGLSHRIRTMTTVNISSTRANGPKTSYETWVWPTDSRNIRNCAS